MAKILPRSARRFSWMTGRYGSIIFVLLSIFIFSLSALQSGPVVSIQMKLADITAPAIHTISTPIRKTADTVRSVTGLADLQAENMRLRQENMKLQEWMQAAQILEKENKTLKGLLNVEINNDFHYISSLVISDRTNAYAHSVLIKSGSKQGVEKGQAVIDNSGMVGRVVAVGKNTARILLLSDINSRIPVMIQGADVKAIMAGGPDGKPVIKRIKNIKANITNGQTIVTSSHGGVLPYGLPVGTLVKNDDGSFSVDLHTNLDQLHFVRVVDSPVDQHIVDINMTK